MDVSEDYLSKNLNVIGQIQLHAKICIRNGNIYIDDSYVVVTSFKRHLMGDNRYDTLEFIRTLIHNTFVLCDRIMLDNTDEQYLSILLRLQNDLVNSKEGLGNIRDTYSNDARIASSVHVLLDNINVQDKKISTFFESKQINNT
tara:strand:+ start:23 stop:454 length:432 start_codon:yes stop_codon:yes gene_type:complete